MRDFEVNKEEQKLKEKEEKKQQRILQLKSAITKKVTGSRSFFGDVEEGFGGKRTNGMSKKAVKAVVGALEDDEFLVDDYCSDDNASRLFYTSVFHVIVRPSHLAAEDVLTI